MTIDSKVGDAEQEVLDLYRSFRRSREFTDEHIVVRGDAQTATRVELQDPEEQAVIEDYHRYKSMRGRTSHSEIEAGSSAALISNIIERCAPELDAKFAEQQPDLPDSTRTTSSAAPTALFASIREKARAVFEILFSPSGAVAATAIIAGLMLYPSLNVQHDPLQEFSSAGGYRFESAVASLDSYLPDSVTRSTTMPDQGDVNAIHYNIGRLIAGMAIVVKARNSDRISELVTQVEPFLEADLNAENNLSAELKNELTAIRSVFEVEAASVEDQNEELDLRFERFVSRLNDRKLVDNQILFEHFGAWSMGMGTVVNAALQSVVIDSSLVDRFVEDLDQLLGKLSEKSRFTVKQNRAVEEFKALVANGVDADDTPQLRSIQESLDRLHIAFKG